MDMKNITLATCQLNSNFKVAGLVFDAVIMFKNVTKGKSQEE